MNDAPAGWYPVPGGGQRFWDGRDWTPDVLGAPHAQAEFEGLSPQLPPPRAPGYAPPLAPAPVRAPAYAAPQAPAYGFAQAQAPGWYAGPSGMMQWWDGRAWGPYAPQSSRPAKDVGIAYLFLIFLGGFSAHRFYLGRTGSAVAQMALWLGGWMLTPFVIGIPLVMLGGLWLIIDLFLLPSMVRGTNARR